MNESTKVSIHALLAECDLKERKSLMRFTVSIHALLAECDVAGAVVVQLPEGFNPRTPCGVRQQLRFALPPIPRFQSTHSLRSATDAESIELISIPVSIHALLAECDSGSVLPLSERTVSIHALLAECDQRIIPGGSLRQRFNPRTPCGVRQQHPPQNPSKTKFQSTHSLRSATSLVYTYAELISVSIHALLAECDTIPKFRLLNAYSFNPRTPCGVRPKMFDDFH